MFGDVVGYYLFDFKWVFILLVLLVVIVFVVENIGYVKVVVEMIKIDFDLMMGCVIVVDGIGIVIVILVGGSLIIIYVENIGVMVVMWVYLIVVYFVVVFVVLLFGFLLKFGVLVLVMLGGVFGGIIVVFYGMIGLFGVKIWKENNVDFVNFVNFVLVVVGIIIVIGDMLLKIIDMFIFLGIVFGMIVVVLVYYLVYLLVLVYFRWVVDIGGVIDEGFLLVFNEFGMYVEDFEDGCWY